MRKTNIGVIGVGYWGKKIVHEYVQLSKQNPTMNLSAVCDPVENNLKCCEDYTIPIMTQYHMRAHAVNICTPNESHFEICKEALEAGKHVLIEKPITLNSAEAYELVELAHKQNLVLSVGHIFRFNNALKVARKLIRNGFLANCFISSSIGRHSCLQLKEET